MSKIKEKILIALAYTILICICYPEVVFLNKTLVPSLYYPKNFLPYGYTGKEIINTFNIDLATPAFYEFPINHLVGNMYKSLDFPLWNPYQGCGTPLLAQYSTRVLFPYQIAEDISPYWLWDYFILGRLLIAGFFTYLFLRRLSLSISSSFLGGAFYMLSGSMIWFINLEQFANVAMLIPVLFFCIEKLFSTLKNSYVVLLAIVFSLLHLAGQPEITIYVLLLAFLYYLFRILSVTERTKYYAKFTIAFLLGIGLSTPLLLPFFEFVKNSFNCHPAGGVMGIQAPTPFSLLISILIPSFFEIPTQNRFFPHNGAWDQLGGYTGIVMLFLAFSAVFLNSSKRKLLLFFLLFGISIILKNLNVYPFKLLGYFPFFDQSWSPRWAGSVWTFSFAIAGSIGLEILKTAKPKKGFLVGSFLFLLYCLLLFFYDSGIIEGLPMLGLFVHELPLQAGIIKLLVSVLILSTVFILTYLFYVLKKQWLVFAIIGIGIFELLFYVPKGPNGLPDRYNIFSKAPYIDFIKNNCGYYRIVAGNGILTPNFSGGYGIFDIRFINALSIASYQNYTNHCLMKVPHTNPTDSLWFTGIRDYFKIIHRSIYQEINENFRHYSFLGVKYIIAPYYIDMNLPLVYSKEVKIYENPYVIPRAFVTNKIKRTNANEIVIDESFTENSNVQIQTYKPNKVILNVHSKKDGLLVLTDTFYPGWKAYINKKSTKIYSVNGIFRGVYINSGENIVIFKYLPTSFIIGLIIAAISIILCIVLLLYKYPKNT